MTGFLLWLLLSSLQACLILPWVRMLVAFSQRAPAAWLSMFLAMGMLAPAITPWLSEWLPGKVVVIPALERTGLFTRHQQIQTREEAMQPLTPSGRENSREQALRFQWKLTFQLWLAGLALATTGRVWHSLRERLRLGKGEPLASDDPLHAEWEAAARSANLQRVPWVMRHRMVDSAMILGVVNPVILLPADFESLPATGRAMILRHEAEHVARRDILGRLALEALRAVFWFNPLFAWALRNYDREVEKACDDAVLRDGWPAKDYAEVLLSQARKKKRGGKELRLRIKALLSRERSRGWTGQGRLALGYLAISLLLLLPAFALKLRPWPDDNAFQALTPRQDLAAWWRCRTGYGNAVDDWSGHGLHGRIFGARWVQDSERGTCLEFDGVTDMLALPATDSQWAKGPLTVAMWLKPRADSDGGGLLLRGEPNNAWSGAKVHDFSGSYAEYGEREFLLAGDIKLIHQGKLNTGLKPGFNLFNIIALRAPHAVAPARWTHVAFVMKRAGDSTLFHCYLDGKLAGSEKFPDAIQDNNDWPTAWWWFGRGESPPVQGNYYEGRLSDLAVLRRALDETAILALMGGQMPE